MDILVSTTALILVSPLMLLIAMIVKASMGGPILFSHRRVGHNGRAFECYKFRTMVANSEEVLKQHLLQSPEAALEWSMTRKLKGDPRITAMGHFLRKSSLDELPQLFNILRGEMSCVGPRPIILDELELYGRHAADYLSARPGLTGAWQVSGRSNLSYEERVRLDAIYIREWSLWKDVVIIMKTIPAVMSSKQAC